MHPVGPSLIVEPDDGMQPVLDFIGAAQKSLLVKQFTFTEQRFIEAVIDRAKAGIYFGFKEIPAVQGSLHGASAAAVALTLAMVVKTGQKCLTGLVPVLLFGASFVLNGLLRWHLPVTLAILAPLSLIWAWPRKTTA